MVSVFLFICTSITYAQIEMVPVGNVPLLFFSVWPCGDANHNGRIEIYGVLRNSDTLVAYECWGRNDFRVIRTSMATGLVLDCGDGDNGLSYLVSERPGHLYLWQSLRRDTFPTELVWTTVPTLQPKYAQFCDLDQDGKREIVFQCNHPGTCLYEERGYNEYQPVPFPVRGTAGRFAIGDFDRDSLMELAAVGPDGVLLVYKCIGNDQYVVSCSLNYWPKEHDGYHVAAANDMDRNGRLEFIALLRVDGEQESLNVKVYEMPGPGSADCVWQQKYNFATFSRDIAVGDVDGDGVQEFAVSTGLEVRLFKCTGPSQYEQVWQYNQGGIDRLRFFDVNNDGRDELIVPPYVLEDTSGLASMAQFVNRTPLTLPGAKPTVSHQGSPILLTDLSPGSMVTIRNSCGEVVRTGRPARHRSWVWNLTDGQDRRVPAGSYFVTITSQEQALQVKFCVVK